MTTWSNGSLNRKGLVEGQIPGDEGVPALGK
jgi:hypothetical protein